MNFDIKSLFNKLNDFSTRSLEGAAGLAVSRSHYEVSIEHLFMKMLDEPNADAQHILRHFEIEPARVIRSAQSALEDLSTGNAGKPVFSPLLIEWIKEGWIIASVNYDLAKVRSGILFLSLITNQNRYSSIDIFSELDGIKESELKQRFFKIVMGSCEDLLVKGERVGKEKVSEKKAAAGTALDRFTINFTENAREGKIDPVFGRDREIRQIIDILARRRKNNPIIVGEPGVGKTAIAEGLALSISDGDVPDILKEVEVLSLDMGLLQAGAGVKGEFENRLKSVINEVKESTIPIILFIDEAHTLIGAGGSAGGSDAANLLKPALARGELRTLAATTWSEYKKYFEKDAALARRFQLVKLDEPSEEAALLMLRGLKDKYEDAHNVIIRDDAVEAAVNLSSRYISGRLLPDKGVDLIDTSCARVKINLTKKPDALEDIERKIQKIEREKKAKQRDIENGCLVECDLSEYDKQVKELTKEAEKLEKRWQREKEQVDKIIATRQQIKDKKNSLEEKPDDEALPKEIKELQKQLNKELDSLKKFQGDEPIIKIEVDPEITSKVVADWTGIPVGNMVKDEAETILHLEKKLNERIKGQPFGIETIGKAIRAAKAGLRNPQTPIGVFLLVGPSGVGKTESSLAVADLLFGGERFMTTINMSEFQEKHTVSRLLGSPPGYVGYGEGGVLTEAVRQRPYSVVLFDEVEKADPDVMNIFYQIFDKGMLADGEGRNIDFKNTIIFMTTNLATDIITEMTTQEEKPDPEDVIGTIRPLLSQHFKPALLARMTIVPYYTISSDVMGEIVKLKLRSLSKRMQDSHKMTMEYTPAVLEHIVKGCTEVETGARNIDHIIQKNLLPRISVEILSKMSEGPLPDKLNLDIDDKGEYILNF